MELRPSLVVVLVLLIGSNANNMYQSKFHITRMLQAVDDMPA